MNRNAFLLILGNFTTRLGTSIYIVALSWWLVVTTESALSIGYILGAAIIPAVILGPFSGSIADTFNRRKILIYSDLASAFLTLIIGILVFLDTFNLIVYMFLSFFLGICTTLFKPAARGILPELITGEDKLVRVNSILSSTTALSSVIGPFLGGVFLLIPFIGVSGSVFINSLTFFISSLLEVFINYKKDIKNTFEIKAIFNKTREGFIFTFKTPFIRNLLILAFLVNIFLAGLDTLLPLFISNVMNGKSQLYSYALTTEAIGGVVTGVVLSIFVVKAEYRKISYCMVFIGTILYVVHVVHTSYFLIFSMFILGLLTVAFDTLYFSFIQENVDSDKLGRVFSIVFMLATLSMGVSYFVLGTISNLIVENTFLIIGLGTILVSLPFIFINIKGTESSDIREEEVI